MEPSDNKNPNSTVKPDQTSVSKPEPELELDAKPVLVPKPDKESEVPKKPISDSSIGSDNF
ncbi:hypothetical protein [Carnobacterium iners]|uniref:hypothetical protein n=1 Tax=Carnobacterium iners TaxID=1073423 RepID=UPI000A1C8991|nr:hypothetical protein [Carnobacterium iners]